MEWQRFQPGRYVPEIFCAEAGRLLYGSYLSSYTQCGYVQAEGTRDYRGVFLRGASGEGEMRKWRRHMRHEPRRILHGQHAVRCVWSGVVLVVYQTKGAAPAELASPGLEVVADQRQAVEWAMQDGIIETFYCITLEAAGETVCRWCDEFTGLLRQDLSLF